MTQIKQAFIRLDPRELDIEVDFRCPCGNEGYAQLDLSKGVECVGCGELYPFPEQFYLIKMSEYSITDDIIDFDEWVKVFPKKA